MYYLHHDDTVVDHTHVNLMRAYHLWVETVRGTDRSPYPGYGEDWEPSDIDVVKSRLFWRIRSGYAPLPWAPPCAYSCPWYELVEDLGNHSAFDCWRHSDDDPHCPGAWVIAQATYDHIETLPDNRHVVGFGEYRFELHRDPMLEAQRIAQLNPHIANCESEHYEEIKDNPDKGWFIRRTPEREIPQPESKLRGWASTLKPSMSTPLGDGAIINQETNT